MTLRQIYKGLLTELSKVDAPSFLLSDFNYFVNKAIQQFVNKKYNVYDINQQTSDDLRVLKSTAILKVQKVNQDVLSGFGAIYETTLPDDYLHILNCVCTYRVNENYKCYNDNDIIQFPAKRLTADLVSTTITDYYNRPLPERPYFYIHNVNNNVGKNIASPADLTPTNSATDITKKFEVGDPSTSVNCNSNFPRSINLSDLFLGTPKISSNVYKEIGQRYGNPSKVRMEIRCGKDNPKLDFIQVLIDYIKTPQYVELTQEQIDLVQDYSQIMEFPDYGCQEIINELTMLVMENIADPRLQTNTTVTQSIKNPAQ